jgi:hypothetical protein
VVRGCGEAIREKGILRISTPPFWRHRFDARLALGDGGQERMLLLSQPSSGFWKTKKIISRAFSNFVVSDKRLKETLSKKLTKLPKLRAIRKRVALNEKNYSPS